MKILNLTLQKVYDSDAEFFEKIQTANRLIADRLTCLNTILQIQQPLETPWTEDEIKFVEAHKSPPEEPCYDSIDVSLPPFLNQSQKELIKKIKKNTWKWIIISAMVMPIIGAVITLLTISMYDSDPKDKNGKKVSGSVHLIVGFIVSSLFVLLPFGLSIVAVEADNLFFNIVGYLILAVFAGVLFNSPKIVNAYAEKRLIEKLRKEKIDHERAIWKQSVEEYEESHRQSIDAMKSLRRDYLTEKPFIIAAYASEVIDRNHGHNINLYDTENEASYIKETETIVVDCLLPAPEDMPYIKEFRYIKSKDEVREINLSQKEKNALYDRVIYQTCLSDIYQVFTTDTIGRVNSIIYNAWVSSIDKATGIPRKTCILSLQTNKQQFMEISLHQVDPKECFRHLGGIGSSQLYSITPIAPIMRVNTEDSRFIDSYDVAHTLDESVNLAAMDWQDFEHLVRETFSKFFSSDNVDVKVTQSSKDKGVDAIAFDPDPIRGGKIVIQAKRYTNVVGVSAVRDLYGTVMNEGAMKGILVTTSHFGGDAYDFVKGKPLTLISGGELLSLLADHGYKARIDLKEAKKILNEKNTNLHLVK